MIDLHSHMLPKIDAGSQSVEASIGLDQETVKNGAQIALMTHHHMNEKYLNHKRDVQKICINFQSELNIRKIPLQVFQSQETRINGGFIKAMKQDDVLFVGQNYQYILLEFPDDDVPSHSWGMMFQIMQQGLTFEITHPERNREIMTQPKILYDLIKLECVAQVTASSYCGCFCRKIQRFSEQMIMNNLAHVFVSDVHELPNRQTKSD